jgi:hypothetical protein
MFGRVVALPGLQGSDGERVQVAVIGDDGTRGVEAVRRRALRPRLRIGSTGTGLIN